MTATQTISTTETVTITSTATATATCGFNVIQNGGFAGYLSPWTTFTEGSGIGYQFIDGPGNGYPESVWLYTSFNPNSQFDMMSIIQVFPTTTGKNYTINFMAYVPTGVSGADFTCSLDHTNGAALTVPTNVNQGTWQNYSFTFVPTSSRVNLQCALVTRGLAGSIYLTGFTASC